MWNPAAGASVVAPRRPLRGSEVLGPLELHEVPIDVEQQRRVELSTVHGRKLLRAPGSERHRKNVHRAHASSSSAKRAQRFLMRVRPMGGQDDELVHSPGLPVAGQVVEHPVERLPVNRCASRELRYRWRVDAIFYGGCSEHPKLGGEVVSKPFNDERIAPQRKMRTMLLSRADRDNEA